MAVYADYRGLPASAKGASIALGNFDGLHAGHRAVMDAARNEPGSQRELFPLVVVAGGTG